MLQARLGTEDKSQNGAPDSSADTQVKGVEFLDDLKKPDGQMRTPHIQMKTGMRLLRRT